jgi:hypothetical protein
MRMLEKKYKFTGKENCRLKTRVVISNKLDGISTEIPRAIKMIETNTLNRFNFVEGSFSVFISIYDHNIPYFSPKFGVECGFSVVDRGSFIN